MKLNRICTGVFCTAALALPMLLPGEVGAMQNRTSRPAQREGGGRGARPAILNGWGGADTASELEAIRDQAFVEDAVEGGYAAVQLGVLATQKGDSSEVKSFGKEIVQDHMMLNDALKPIAEAMEVKVPYQLNEKDQDEYDRLNQLPGSEFDKEYLADMVKDHHKDLQAFQAENAVVKNPALKAAVEKGVSVIQKHTQMVDELAKSKGVSASGE